MGSLVSSLLETEDDRRLREYAERRHAEEQSQRILNRIHEREQEEARQRQRHAEEQHQRILTHREQEEARQRQRNFEETQFRVNYTLEAARQRQRDEEIRYQQLLLERANEQAKRYKLTLIFSLYDTLPWSDADIKYIYKLVLLNAFDDDLQTVKNLFYSTSKNQGLKLLRVYRCQNPTLYGQYLLKKDEMHSRNGTVSTHYLFHGTKIANLDNIFKHNIDWRRHGSHIGNRFGKGASFSSLAAYASHYCDKKVDVKAMIVFQVVMSYACEGNGQMTLPDIYDYKKQLRYDTAVKDNKFSVAVKFSDFEFYPMYKIEFRGNPKKST